MLSRIIATTAALTITAMLASACHSPARATEMDDPNGKKVDAKKDYYRALPPGAHALRKITDPAMIPDFTPACRDLSGLSEQIDRSLNYLGKPSALNPAFFPISGITHAQVVESLKAFKALIAEGGSASELNEKIRERFDVYMSIGCDDQGTVLYTGYYVPILDASLTKTAEYKYPLYKLPANHVKDPITGETKGRMINGQLDPNYPGRKELLESGELAGTELVWFNSPWDAYNVSVQGSAILKLTDGSRLEIGYDGTNGKDYTSIGKLLIADGKLKKEDLSAPKLRAYFNQHPDELATYANKNERYIFFKQADGGPFGSLNERVIGMRSIATDKSIFPRGALTLIDTQVPEMSNTSGGGYRGFLLDQDTGGAIRAPGRCDIFMGVGDEAGERAGHTLAEGKLYYLILKE